MMFINLNLSMMSINLNLSNKKIIKLRMSINLDDVPNMLFMHSIMFYLKVSKVYSSTYKNASCCDNALHLNCNENGYD